MRRIALRYVLGGCCLLFSGRLLAADNANKVSETSAIALDEAVVSAKRDSATMPTEDIVPLQSHERQVTPGDTSRTSNTADVLSAAPGVSMQGNGGLSGIPFLNGLGDDRVRIKVDGMNLISACANHMNPPLSYIAPTNVGTIKILAGITPVSVGGDSIAGTIQVDSTAPEFAEPGEGVLARGQVGAFYRSNGNAEGAQLSAATAGEHLSIRYAGSYAKSDNYHAAEDFKPAGKAASDRGWLEGDEIGSSRYEAWNHDLGIALRTAGHLVDLKLGLQDILYQGFPNQRMDMTGNDSIHGNLSYTGQYQWGVLEARLYGDQTQHSMDFGDDKQFAYGPNPPSTVVAPGMPMKTEGENLGAQVKADIPLSDRDLLRVGGEYQRYRLDDWWPPSPSSLDGMYSSPGVPATTGGMAPNTFWNIKNGQRDRYDVFAEWEARWDPRWFSLLGVRSDTVEMDTGTVQGYNNGMMYGDPQSPTSTPGRFNAADRQRTDYNFDVTALVRYAPAATQAYEFGYARKTRSPNFYERYAWSKNTMAMEMINFAGDGNFYIGNLDLEPEVADTLSVTADLHDDARKQWGLKVTPFYTYVQDYIDARRCPAGVCGDTPAVNASANATTGYVYLQFANQNARLYGADVSGHFLLAETTTFGSFTATGVLSYARGENRTTGDDLYNVMPLNGKLALVQRVGTLVTTIEGLFVDEKSRVSHVRNEVKTAGYSLLNLRGSYTWKNVRLDLGVENVLNTYYEQPLGGMYVGQGATMSGNAIPWGDPVPGLGRSFYAALTVAI